jgi:hypothetical protein
MNLIKTTHAHSFSRADKIQNSSYFLNPHDCPAGHTRCQMDYVTLTTNILEATALTSRTTNLIKLSHSHTAVRRGLWSPSLTDYTQLTLLEFTDICDASHANCHDGSIPGQYVYRLLYHFNPDETVTISYQATNLLKHSHNHVVPKCRVTLTMQPTQFENDENPFGTCPLGHTKCRNTGFGDTVLFVSALYDVEPFLDSTTSTEEV